jgi:hypothetical protein
VEVIKRNRNANADSGFDLFVSCCLHQIMFSFFPNLRGDFLHGYAPQTQTIRFKGTVLQLTFFLASGQRDNDDKMQ